MTKTRASLASLKPLARCSRLEADDLSRGAFSRACADHIVSVSVAPAASAPRKMAPCGLDTRCMFQVATSCALLPGAIRRRRQPLPFWADILHLDAFCADPTDGSRLVSSRYVDLVKTLSLPPCGTLNPLFSATKYGISPPAFRPTTRLLFPVGQIDLGISQMRCVRSALPSKMPGHVLACADTPRYGQREELDLHYKPKNTLVWRPGVRALPPSATGPEQRRVLHGCVEV